MVFSVSNAYCWSYKLYNPYFFKKHYLHISKLWLNINNIIELLTTNAVNKASFNSNFCPTEILKIES